MNVDFIISTHAPAGGATAEALDIFAALQFLLTPLREGRLGIFTLCSLVQQFLLTPLREGRRLPFCKHPVKRSISTHAPAGGATSLGGNHSADDSFLLTPLREGRRTRSCLQCAKRNYFYSRPCGRGDDECPEILIRVCEFLLTPLREGRLLNTCLNR